MTQFSDPTFPLPTPFAGVGAVVINGASYPVGIVGTPDANSILGVYSTTKASIPAPRRWSLSDGGRGSDRFDSRRLRPHSGGSLHMGVDHGC